MKIDELLDKYFEGETSCEEEREPVSYTHLDVYKRQPQRRTLFSATSHAEVNQRFS